MYSSCHQREITLKKVPELMMSVRDDLTVEVIFFGEGADEGTSGDRIFVNSEATAQNQTRSKL